MSIPKHQTPTISRVKCFLWDFLLSTLCVYSHRQWFAWPTPTISLPLSVARIYRSPSAPTLSLTDPPCSRGGKQRTLLPSGSSHWFSTLVTLPIHYHHPLFLHPCFCLLSTPRAHAVTRSHATNTCSCLPLRSYGRGGNAMHIQRHCRLITKISANICRSIESLCKLEVLKYKNYFAKEK